MKIRIFSIPTQDPDTAQAELNAFLSSHRVVQLERQFVADAANSFWSMCVTYLDGGSRPAGDKGFKGEKIDYRDVLPEVEFAIYAQLRTLRKELSERDGVPAYAVFTNEQMAEMVRQKVTSLTALQKIKGIGSARVEKYGPAFVTLLVNLHGKPPSGLFGDDHGESKYLP